VVPPYTKPCKRPYDGLLNKQRPSSGAPKGRGRKTQRVGTRERLDASLGSVYKKDNSLFNLFEDRYGFLLSKKKWMRATKNSNVEGMDDAP
jgi:hypothetical protein